MRASSSRSREHAVLVDVREVDLELVRQDRLAVDARAIDGLGACEYLALPRVLDLRRPRQPGRDRQDPLVLAGVLGDEALDLGPRPHEPHVALQHVPDLRQLVEAAERQPAPQRRVALVPGGAQRRPLGVARHRAELEHLEHQAALADPLRAVDHRARASRGRRRRRRSGPSGSRIGSARTISAMSRTRSPRGILSATFRDRRSRAKAAMVVFTRPAMRA